MGDQQLYKTNHVAHGGENLFYQQPPLGVHSGLNHNYGNTVTGGGMDAPQASPISPHFPQDTRDGLGLPVGSKNLGQMDTSRQGGWGSHAGPGNHVQLRGNLANSNMMWGAPTQVEPADGYQYTYSQASEIRTQKLTSGVLHKLDSFTQVFANQNLRIQVNNMAQVLHTQSAVMDGAPDSALRQLLSQKPMEPPAPAIPSRYQQVTQQAHPGFTGGSGQPKGVFGEQFDAKSKLTCSICLKEFKSLPALNGHMRSHGGMRASPSLKQLPPEAESLTPMVMPVSVPVKLLPPKPSSQGFTNSVVAVPSARDKPASSVSDDEMPVLGAAPHKPAEIPRKHQPAVAKAEEPLKTVQEKKKFRHRPEPLFIPPPPSYTPTPASYSGATLYQSQLRSPRVLGDHLLLDPTHELPPYTPPPMLSPVRQGSGLFSNVLIAGHGPGAHPQLPLTPLTPTPRVLLCRSNSIDGSNMTVTPGPGEQTVDVEPRINIGLRFQAEIPELQDVSALAQDTHKATLVWKPWPELENQDLQQRVENLLNLCCSSALPGGGTNSEFALHSLFEAKGDVMAALEMLLLQKPVRLKCHPLANYHYAGTDKWTSLERKLFNKALATYSKDFIFVQKMVKSKTVAQCVEYYYTWKKIMRLGRKHRTRLAEIIDDCVTSEEEEELEEEEEDLEEDRKSTKEEESELPKSPEPPPVPVLAPTEGPPLQALGQPSGSFICEMPNCGAVFSSRQALNGHARIHGGTNQVTKTRGAVPSGKQKPGSTQSGYCSVKSSPSHSTTSGETDPTTIFPCKECGNSTSMKWVQFSNLHIDVPKDLTKPTITISDEPDTLYKRLSILVKGHDKAVLDSYEYFAVLAAKELGISVKVHEPPRKIERFTLLKSVHIFKKHRVQYEMRTLYRCLELEHLTGCTADVYLEYIQRNLPEGVAMEVTKTQLEQLPDHIKEPIWETVPEKKEESKS
ncbi:Transcriptional-regulating factor 1 [Sciurus carolinensis]|uniref:Small ribosomal subunit protein uS10m n=1 Tax=Sciurus carolinensis TaxID=30640 RepID=A0AA41SME8_SCICA|nr:Transcriptional-regulating factor 1 [Sciurus carolinensis]